MPSTKYFVKPAVSQLSKRQKPASFFTLLTRVPPPESRSWYSAAYGKCQWSWPVADEYVKLAPMARSGPGGALFLSIGADVGSPPGQIFCDAAREPAGLYRSSTPALAEFWMTVSNRYSVFPGAVFASTNALTVRPFPGGK